MRRRTWLAALCLGLALSALANPPIPADAVTWERLSRRATSSKPEILASDAIDPAWKGTHIVAWRPLRSMSLAVYPGSAGRFRLTLATVAGGEFAPCEILLNGQSLGRSAEADSPREQALSFDLQGLSVRGNQLTLRPQRRGLVGLVYVHWEPLDWELAPATAWQRDGDDLVTWLHSPDPLRGYWLRHEGGGALHVNGKAVASALPAYLPASHFAEGFTQIRLVGEIDPSLAALSINATGDTRWSAKAPDEALPEDWPRHELANKRLTLTVALPDHDTGYYRSVRFEPGMIVSMVADGTEFAGRVGGAVQQPVLTGSASGLAEEFCEPLGYEDAALGQPFIKVGVGILRKALIDSYSFAAPYQVERRFPWELATPQPRELVLRQRATTDAGWGYDYRKHILLDPQEPVFTIRYQLTNTGSRTIDTTHYSHNITQVPDSGCGIDFNSPVVPSPAPSSGLVSIAGSQIRVGPLQGVAFMRLIPASAAQPLSAVIRFGERRVTYSHDFVPVRSALYVDEHGVSPEFFKRLHLLPGQTATWERTVRID